VAVEKALGIDPNLAEAHFARGLLLWNHAKRFPHEQAVQSYKKSLALDPMLDEAHHQLGVIYFHLGLFDKAQAEIDKALEINPGNTLARFRYGVIAMYRGHYEDSYEFFKSTPLEKNPSLHAFQTATVLFKLGRTAEAEALIEKYLREYPKDEGGVGTSVRAMILATSGRVKEAEQAIAKADEIGRDFGHFHHTAYNLAAASAMLGKQDDAIRYLQLAADDGFPCYPLFANDESFKSLRSNSQFVALLAKMKQQWDRYNATF
jgi:tetratricopeptide (TPR) repeat protein